MLWMVILKSCYLANPGVEVTQGHNYKALSSKIHCLAGEKGKQIFIPLYKELFLEVWQAIYTWRNAHLVFPSATSSHCLSCITYLYSSGTSGLCSWAVMEFEYIMASPPPPLACPPRLLSHSSYPGGAVKSFGLSDLLCVSLIART